MRAQSQRQVEKELEERSAVTFTHTCHESRERAQSQRQVEKELEERSAVTFTHTCHES